MSLAPGTRLGPYEILAPLGAGGMGEVYRARDTTLHRDVAIKILPESFASDPARLARFQREAQVLASLNHPHIAHIHGLEESHGVRALVMELVEGEDLAHRIARGPIPLDDALPIARQIADALEAAHEQGIVHRDLKPANIKIRTDGTVKVLDFGLAKAIDAAASRPDALNSPTLSIHGTQAGIILGTAAYMSPEQARGRVVDRRADIWAFGVVLYEMLSGRRAFAGDDISITLASVLKDDVKWEALPADLSAPLRRLLRRCLEKDPRRRLSAIADARLELDDAASTSSEDRVAGPAAAIAPAPSRTRERLIWISALLLASIGASAIIWWWRAPVALPETRLEIVAPQTTDFTFAISPNGRQVVFVAPNGGQPVFWLRALDNAVARPLAGTEGGTNPFWSPDSQSIGFFAQAKLKRLDLVTGAVQTITDGGATPGGAWAPSNVILYRRPGAAELVRISASGGEPATATTLANGATNHVQPQFLPDGRQFVFFCNGPENVRGIYLGSLDNQEITRLTDADAGGRFVPPGWLAYIRQGTLVARQLDLTRRSMSGEVVLIAESVGYETTAARRAAFSVSGQGLIAYRTGSASQRQLTWFDRHGKALGTHGQADDTIVAPELSPDGGRVAANRNVPGNTDIWVIDALRTTRLTFDPAADVFPVWSPDGARIVFTATRNGKSGLYVKSATGAGGEELLAERPPGGTVFNGSTSWSRDGRFLLFDVNNPGGDVWALPVTGDRKPYPFLSGSYTERLALFSPDGHWVAYTSLESGRAEVYIRPFPGPGGQWQVSTTGGAQPRWRNDGKELYWIAPDAKLMAASIAAKGNSVELGAPVVLFQTRIYLGGTDQPIRGQYNVAPDGRFLINTILSDEAVLPITVVQNWRPAQ